MAPQERHPSNTSIFNAQLTMLPLSGVTERYGIEGLYQRFALDIATFDIEDQHFCNRALYVASVLHKDDVYKGLPYASHLMRTALRLIRDYDVRDADIIAAMLLHDSVEDHADQLASFAPVETVPAQADTTQKALAALGLSFSVTVSELVHNVTNSPHTTAVSQEQKNAAYAEGVAIKIAKSPETFLMKLSDFTDNAVGIMWSEQTSKVKKLATKYLPVFEVFLQQLSVYEDSASLTPKQITTARQQLLIGKQRCSLLAA